MRLQIEYVDPRKLKADRKNARKHGKADLAALGADIGGMTAMDYIESVDVSALRTVRLD